MRHPAIFRKILLCVVVASMLWLQLASIVPDPAFADAICAAALMAKADGTTETCFLKPEPECSLGADLIPAVALRLPGEKLRPSAQPAPVAAFLKDIVAEILTPPKIAA